VATEIAFHLKNDAGQLFLRVVGLVSEELVRVGALQGGSSPASFRIRLRPRRRYPCRVLSLGYSTIAGLRQAQVRVGDGVYPGSGTAHDDAEVRILGDVS
jgi:hypothetical protein